MAKRDVSSDQETLFALLAQLETKLVQLSDCVKSESHLSCFTQSGPIGQYNWDDCREKASLIYRAVNYQEEQDKNSVISVGGFIGATDSTVMLAYEINDAKQAIKDFFKLHQGKSARDDQGKVITYTTLLFNNMSRKRLNKKQLVRDIPVINENVSSFGFTWSKLPNATKITRSRVIELISDRPEKDLWTAKLEASSDDTFLLVKSPVYQLKANIVYYDEGGEKIKCMKKSALPILFRQNENTPTPKHSIGDKSKSDRLTRSDNKRGEPLIVELGIFFYLA